MQYLKHSLVDYSHWKRFAYGLPFHNVDIMLSRFGVNGVCSVILRCSRLALIMYRIPLDNNHSKRNKNKFKYIIYFFYIFFIAHENPWKVPKIRLFSTFLLSFLHFTKYFLYFSQSKTMNRMGGGLHQKERFFADLPCTLLSTYTYPKIFNTPSKIP